MGKGRYAKCAPKLWSGPSNHAPKVSMESVFITPKMAEQLLKLPYVNSRVYADGGKEVRFTVGANGRMDSFTESCDTLAKAEQMFEFPFAKESDHLFCYVKASRIEPSKLDGYALMIFDKKLYVLGGLFAEDGLIAIKEISPLEAGKLLDYLYQSGFLLKDDTTFEQMRWVQDAQMQGLLDPGYPTFKIGFDKGGIGMGRYRAFPVGEPLPEGCMLYPGQ